MTRAARLAVSMGVVVVAAAGAAAGLAGCPHGSGRCAADMYENNDPPFCLRLPQGYQLAGARSFDDLQLREWSFVGSEPPEAMAKVEVAASLAADAEPSSAYVRRIAGGSVRVLESRDLSDGAHFQHVTIEHPHGLTHVVSIERRTPNGLLVTCEVSGPDGVYQRLVPSCMTLRAW